jgi:hypothetical protein
MYMVVYKNEENLKEDKNEDGLTGLHKNSKFSVNKGLNHGCLDFVLMKH